MSEKPDGLVFFQRVFPSANAVLLTGERPILVDTGFGGDFRETERLLREAGTPPENLSMILNTHFHCDHAGGNHGLQYRYDVPIAAHRWEAGLVNRRDPEACGARWLTQPVEPYEVNRVLSDGDEVEAGGTVLRVLHTPGHTLGHVSFYLPEERALIVGDVFHADDVAWLNPFREGPAAIDRALESLDRLAELPLRWACSGHGPAIEDPASAIDTARRRYEKWLEDPEKVAWHACKRIFAYALMLEDGMNENRSRDYLLGSPWFSDYARHSFGSEPADFIQPLTEEMLRSGAGEWRDGLLRAAFPYTAPPGGWPPGPARPEKWSPAST